MGSALQFFIKYVRELSPSRGWGENYSSLRLIRAMSIHSVSAGATDAVRKQIRKIPGRLEFGGLWLAGRYLRVPLPSLSLEPTAPSLGLSVNKALDAGNVKRLQNTMKLSCLVTKAIATWKQPGKVNLSFSSHPHLRLVSGFWHQWNPLQATEVSSSSYSARNQPSSTNYFFSPNIPENKVF